MCALRELVPHEVLEKAAGAAEEGGSDRYTLLRVYVRGVLGEGEARAVLRSVRGAEAGGEEEGRRDDVRKGVLSPSHGGGGCGGVQ